MEVLKFCGVSVFVFTMLAIVDQWRYGYGTRVQNHPKRQTVP